MGFEILNVVDQNIDNLRNQKDNLVKKKSKQCKGKKAINSIGPLI